MAEVWRCTSCCDFFPRAVRRCGARGRAGSVTRWALKSRRVERISSQLLWRCLVVKQPHTAYLAAGKRASGVADPAVMRRCRCFSFVSRATLMRTRDARHNIYICVYIYIFFLYQCHSHLLECPYQPPGGTPSGL